MGESSLIQSSVLSFIGLNMQVPDEKSKESSTDNSE
jgi:hypothetical protein